MTIIRASKLEHLIASKIAEDQGSSFRQHLKVLLPKMEDAYRGESKPFRKHLGASLIGRDCSRALWYGFRWVKRPRFEGRTLRLFNRGHLEEARFLAMLQVAGCQIWYETDDGGQFQFSAHRDHYGSSLDGVVRGVPDLPETNMYAEFKTHNDKSFKKLVKVGVRDAKFEHYVQCQQCMKAFDLPWALYMAVNKNDDDLYCELIQYDSETADKYYERANKIICSDQPLPKISNTPGYFGCKFCDYSKLCHLTEVPEINCRTCACSTPTENAEWYCSFHKTELTPDEQLQGCGQHVFNPYILNKVEYLGGNEEEHYTKLKLPNGETIKQGPNHITSLELKGILK